MSIVRPQDCILTVADNLNNFPLIVSHSDYKRIQVGGDNSDSKMVGFQFFKTENADSYEKVLKQLGVEHKRVLITLPVDDSQFKIPKRELTVEMVKRLREASGFSMMECRKALIDANFDHEEALSSLQYVKRAQHRLTTCRR